MSADRLSGSPALSLSSPLHVHPSLELCDKNAPTCIARGDVSPPKMV